MVGYEQKYAAIVRGAKENVVRHGNKVTATSGMINTCTDATRAKKTRMAIAEVNISPLSLIVSSHAYFTNKQLLVKTMYLFKLRD